MGNATFFQTVIYILCSISLIVLIFLGIKAIITLTKFDKLVDDISEKSKKIDGAFNMVDKLTDTVSSVSDRFIGLIFNGVTGIAKKVKKNKERNDEDE